MQLQYCVDTVTAVIVKAGCLFTQGQKMLFVLLQECFGLLVAQFFCLLDIPESFCFLFILTLCNAQDQIGVRKGGIQLYSLPCGTCCRIHLVQTQEKTSCLSRIQWFFGVEA